MSERIRPLAAPVVETPRAADSLDVDDLRASRREPPQPALDGSSIEQPDGFGRPGEQVGASALCARCGMRRDEHSATGRCTPSFTPVVETPRPAETLTCDHLWKWNTATEMYDCARCAETQEEISRSASRVPEEGAATPDDLRAALIVARRELAKARERDVIWEDIEHIVEIADVPDFDPDGEPLDLGMRVDLLSDLRNLAEFELSCGQKALEAATAECSRLRAALDARSDLAEAALGVIENVSGGDWIRQSAEWIDAAERWRGRYYESLGPSAPERQPETERP